MPVVDPPEGRLNFGQDVLVAFRDAEGEILLKRLGSEFGDVRGTFGVAPSVVAVESLLCQLLNIAANPRLQPQKAYLNSVNSDFFSMALNSDWRTNLRGAKQTIMNLLQ